MPDVATRPAARKPRPLALPAGLVAIADARTVLGHNLAVFRKRAGYTQSRLAEIVGLKTGTLNTYEHGTEPPIAVLVQLARALGLTLDQLLLA